MQKSSTVIPIYTSRGDVGAYLVYPYIYNSQGEWIGWTTPDRRVYSIQGFYVGWLSNDPRILRKRSEGIGGDRQPSPSNPPPLVVPARVPLPPMMSELTMGTMDVLEEVPDLLPSIDFGELRSDLD